MKEKREADMQSGEGDQLDPLSGTQREQQVHSRTESV